MAIQGKMVPQDPKEKLGASNIKEDADVRAKAPFGIPSQWIWSCLNKLADINGGFAFKSHDYSERGTRVIRISDFDEFGFKDHKVVRHSFAPELEKFTLEEGNILMAMTGGTVGKSYYVRSLPEPMIVNQRVATIKVSPEVNPSYIDLLIRSEITQEVIRNAKNSTNDNISMGDINGSVCTPPQGTTPHRGKVNDGLGDGLDAARRLPHHREESPRSGRCRIGAMIMNNSEHETGPNFDDIEFAARGSYEPGFIHLRINTYDDLGPGIDKLLNNSDPPEWAGTFLHEYIHFLQDISSTQEAIIQTFRGELSARFIHFVIEPSCRSPVLTA